MTAIRGFFVKGMGGSFRLFDAGILDVRADLLANDLVLDGGTFTYPRRDALVAFVRNAISRGEKVAIFGHSLGAVTGCSVTDYCKVDLLVLYDIAGAVPSKLGRNTIQCLDFYDVAADVVPEWRPEAIKGYENRIRRYRGALGHVQCPFNADWRRIVKATLRYMMK